MKLNCEKEVASAILSDHHSVEELIDKFDGFSKTIVLYYKMLENVRVFEAEVKRNLEQLEIPNYDVEEIDDIVITGLMPVRKNYFDIDVYKAESKKWWAE